MKTKYPTLAIETPPRPSFRRRTTDRPKTGRKRLKGHTPLRRSTLQGWAAIAFGLIFVLMGIPILAIGVEWVHVPASSIHAPLWIITLFGGLFVTCGGWYVLHGVLGLYRSRKTAQGKKQLPNRPWEWDYPWRPEGSTDNHSKEIVNGLAALAIFGVLLTPFNWLAFASDHGGLFWQLLTGVFDIMAIAGLGKHLMTQGEQYFAFGNATVRFQDFPFFLSHKMSLTLEGLPKNITGVQLDLRCIEEAYELQEREGRLKKDAVVACYQIYHDSQTIPGNQITPNGSLRCSWVLPHEKHLSSKPGERPATIWELEILGIRPGLDYHSRFLLPVYSKVKAIPS